jgi:hypothetical protein
MQIGQGSLDIYQSTVPVVSIFEREYSESVMFNRTRNRIAKTRSKGFRTVVILFLCLSVFMQMLGVPVTFLSPALSPDTLGASVLEGFSIPPTMSQLTFSAQTAPATEAQPSVHALVLASSLFHPPVL